MSDLNYAYAVARIRVLEKYLLSDSDIEQMIAMPTDDAVLAFLKERGWGDESNAKETPETVLSEETAKTNALVRELKVEPEVLEVFSYQEMYHNLKAAIKEVCSQDTHPGIFLASEDYGREKMLRIVREQAFDVMILNKKERTITAVRIGCPAEGGTGNDPGEEVEERVVHY